MNFNGDDLTLSNIADVLVGVESVEMLLHCLEQLLSRASSLPARLWLIDTEQMVFYCVAGFACERLEEDLPATAIFVDPEPGQYVLYHRGDPVGLLSLQEQGFDARVLQQIAAFLGPALMGVDNHEQTLRELRHMHLQADRLIAAGRLLQHLDVEVLLTEIMQCILDTVQADVGAILVNDAHEQLSFAVSWGLREEHIDALRTRSGERLVDAVLETGQNLRLHGQELRKEIRYQFEDATLTGIMALPLISSDRKHGVVLLANPEQRFSHEDERLVTVVCDMAAIALDNLRLVETKVANERLQRDMEVARQVQARMLPQDDMTLAQLHVTGISLPSEETGGDYYTWIERDGHLAALIGDVTGHGLGAALFTTAAHAMVQYQLRNSRDLAHALEALNQGLYHMRSGRFMTCAAVEVDLKNLTFTYASAGHNPLCWVHGQDIHWLESSGTPLGIMRESKTQVSAPQQLAPGDIILLYTDGITEAFNPAGEWWGEEALAQSLRRACDAGLSGNAIIDYLQQDMQNYIQGRPLSDDVTLVVITVEDR